MTQKFVKNDDLRCKMTDQWQTLQKNVSKILKKQISIKDLKHIVAVINVMENAGLEFNWDPVKGDYTVNDQIEAFIRGQVSTIDYLGVPFAA